MVEQEITNCRINWDKTEHQSSPTDWTVNVSPPTECMEAIYMNTQLVKVPNSLTATKVDHSTTPSKIGRNTKLSISWCQTKLLLLGEYWRVLAITRVLASVTGPAAGCNNPFRHYPCFESPQGALTSPCFHKIIRPQHLLLLKRVSTCERGSGGANNWCHTRHLMRGFRDCPCCALCAHWTV